MAKRPLWLVTGGAGFIGSNIAEELVKRGKRVRILDNFITGQRRHMKNFIDKVELQRGDIRNPAACRKAVKGATYVIHQAALRSVPKSVDDPNTCNDINITGTLNMLHAAHKEKSVTRFVYASSSSVYGGGTKFPQKEDFEPNPVSPYAVSKLAGEHYCRTFSATFGLETVSLRYFNVFGPRQDPESMYSAVIPKFYEQAIAGKPLDVHWDGKQSRDFTYIKNVVSANILGATRPAKYVAGQYFNIANGKTYTLLDVIRVLEKILGRELALKHHPKRAGDVRKTFASIAKARRLLAYKPLVGLEEGLEDTFRWFQTQKF